MNRLVYILNGPNLNLLGEREPEIYGRETLADIERQCRKQAEELGLEIYFRQSNAEHELVEWIQEARHQACGIIINPAAFTFTSVSIMDALKISPCPIIEVHISALHKREAFRQVSYVSYTATGVVKGFGTQGYLVALQRIATLTEEAAKSNPNG